MNKPLKGKRVIVTRSREQAEPICRKLEALGAVAISLPAIEFAPLPAPELDRALECLADFDWLIFTSGNAVRFFWERLGAANLALATYNNLRIATIGSATNRLLAMKGIEVAFTPEEFTGEQLARGLGDVNGKKILLPRARIGRPEITNLLRERGAIVSDIGFYDTVMANPNPEAVAELEHGIDVITFTSPSSVRNFLALVGRCEQSPRPIIACIGPSTAAAACEQGLEVDVIPGNYTIDALISAVAAYCAKDYANA